MSEKRLPKEKRSLLDHYETPLWCAAIGARLATATGTNSILDPCAGGGNLLAAAKQRNPEIRAYGIEIDAGRATANGFLCADALQINWPQTDAILMNPPFSLWVSFVSKALACCHRVVVLGRLGMVCSQKRFGWWSTVSYQKGVSLYFTGKRPSFTNDGRTDGTDYAWYVFSDDKQKTGIFWVPFAGGE